MKYQSIIILIIFSLLPVLFFGDDNAKTDSTTDNSKVNAKPKAPKKDEARFQIGLGLFGNSTDFLNWSENFGRFKAIQHGSNYGYPGYSQDSMDSIQGTDKWMQDSILLGYILRDQEYGGDLRILYKFFMSEIDLSFLPTDNFNPLRSVTILSPMVGFRSPKTFMPYFLAGPNFTLSYDTNKLSEKNSWHNKIQDFENTFVFNTGLITKAGFDLKFERFSIGTYYQYQINDFNDVNYWYIMYRDGGATKRDLFNNVFLANSRIGLALNVYLF